MQTNEPLTVLCAACSHNIREGEGCDCHCHWDCERYGMHRWGGTPEEIERRLLVCTRCAMTMPLVEANLPPFDEAR